VRVELGGTITGVVVDASGTPVAGARVTGYGRAESDAAGRFTLPGVPPGEYEVSATTDHSASSEIKLVLAKGATADIKLVVGDGTLAGRVVDRHGLATGDATVRATHVASGRKWRAYVDDEGAFDFGGIEPGDYRISVERTTVTYADDLPTTIVHAGDRKLRLVLPDLSKIVGRVMLGGRPVANFGVSITAPDSSTDPTPVRTDTGRFERTDVASGVWNVTLVGPDFAKKTLTGIRAIDGHTTDLGDIAVEAARIVTGRVVDQLGNPVANARVEVTDGRPSDDDTMARLIRDNAVTRTDATGAFRIANLPRTDGELQISATHAKAGATLPRVLAASETEITLVIEPTGVIDGAIANLDDRQYDAVATRVGTDSEQSAELEHGGFHFTRLPAGDYDVRIHGTNTLSPIRVTVTAGRHAQVAFALPVTPITLRIEQAGCDLIRIEDLGGNTVGLELCKAGRGELANVSPGRYNVCVDLADCSPIEVVPGITVQTVAIP
jgi:protocatechuate 3,4-dioxygenase beta subunit